MAFNQKFVVSVVILCCVLGEIMCEDILDTSSEAAEGRTFGHHFLKRISFAIIPAAFVVGVITTLLAALTVVSLKSVGIGSILLVLALGQLLARSLPQGIAPQPYSAAPIPIIYGQREVPAWR